MTTPLFSVIVPLEYHRGQWERCLLGWQAQTVPKTQYEMILVVPPHFSEQEKLLALLGPRDRLEYSTERHDISLCAIGAARAHGQFLFFTESHCWPEPDVLEKCLQAFTTHPEWVAFSCRSIRIAHDRLSNAEADMYEADIEFGMKSHPWRKILDQCFVTRRAVYEECGGLKSELGHFAEWVLAANFAGFGHKIGYLPEACLHHYYIGQLAELRTFTRDFIIGEMRYFAKDTHDPGGHLLEVPPEWSCQGNWDRRLAQRLLRIAMCDMLAPSFRRLQHPLAFLRTPARWLMPTIAGENPAIAGAAVKVGLARVMANLAALAGSKARLGAAFKNYVAALIRRQRLICLKSERGTATKTDFTSRVDSKSGWDAFAPGNAGFYPIETYRETRFRWSEPAAIMLAWMSEGRHCIRIECLRAGLRFYVNEQPLSDRDVSIGLDTIDITFDLAQSGHCTLGWTCLRFRVKGDSRWLGLPIKRIVWKPDPQKGG
jgi:hypothetical protein